MCTKSENELILIGLKCVVKKHQEIINQCVKMAEEITGDEPGSFTSDWFWDFPSEDYTARQLLDKFDKD